MGYILQWPWVFFDYFVTHFLCFKVIRNMPQHAWDLLECPFTHALCLKVVGDISQHERLVVHGLVAHFLCFKIIRVKQRHISFMPLIQGSNVMDRTQIVFNDAYFCIAQVALVLVLKQRFLIVPASPIFRCVRCLDTFFSRTAIEDKPWIDCQFFLNAH